jgi:hypothetical protein
MGKGSTKESTSIALEKLLADVLPRDPMREIVDTKIAALAERVARTMCLAADKASLHHANSEMYPMPEGEECLENLFLSRLRSLPVARQHAAVTDALISSVPTEGRTAFFRDVTGIDVDRIDMRSTLAIEEQVARQRLPERMRLDEERLRRMELPEIWGPSHAVASLAGWFSGIEIPVAPPPQEDMKVLEFRIHSVRCVDETGGGWGGEWGSDEIYLGANTIDETGDTKKVDQFKVGDFDDGDVVNFETPRLLTAFDLTEGNEWPKSYVVVLAMSEVDQGGFAEFLDKMFDKVQAQVIAALAAAIGGAIGASGGVVGFVIGAAVGYVVGRIFDWLSAAWADDIFKPKAIGVNIDSYRHSWAGRLNSPEAEVTFSGHDGRYHVVYDWRLSNRDVNPT